VPHRGQLRVTDIDTTTVDPRKVITFRSTDLLIYQDLRARKIVRQCELDRTKGCATSCRADGLEPGSEP
jgi:hypothetical protein